jgi:phospholipid/cholesterol/gamma-HCH transport system permease protein
MRNTEEIALNHNSQTPARAGLDVFSATTGQWVINQVQGLIQFVSIAIAVIWQSLRPLTWRRPVRAEFFRQCYHVGVRAVPFIFVTSSLVGFGIVYQVIYWLDLFGQTEFAGSILVIILVREVIPLFVALIVIGRRGSVIMVELGNMKIGGQLRMLDAQGIDPFLFIVIPRVTAVAVCMFSLTITFIAVALGSGLLAAKALIYLDFTLNEFVYYGILSEMGLAEFAIIPLKSILIGFVVALISCTTGLAVSGTRSDILAALPRGVTKSVLAALFISGLLTLLL